MIGAHLAGVCAYAVDSKPTGLCHACQ